MKRPTVGTVMTSDVVTVSPDASFKDVISALADREILGASRVSDTAAPSTVKLPVPVLAAKFVVVW